MGNELAFTFPGGLPRTIAIAATAGNVVTNLSPTLGFRWIVLRGRIVFTADGTAANRSFTVLITDGTNTVEELAGSGTAITATQLAHINFGEYSFEDKDSTPGGGGGNVNQYIPIQPLILDDLEQLRMSFYLGVAGDSYEGYFKVLEVRI